MKRWLAALVMLIGVLSWHGVAHAACTHHTYVINGQIISCTTCCAGVTCSTNCY